jgi:hypothetical protein
VRVLAKSKTDFRFALDNGLKSDIAPLPKGANKRHGEPDPTRLQGVANRSLFPG